MIFVVIDSHENLVPLTVFSTRQEQQYQVTTGVGDDRVVKIDCFHSKSASYYR